MKDRVPANPGRVLITPENGAAAYYATMTRADNPVQEGDPLNKSTLLKDTTAELFGLGSDAVPDDVLVSINGIFALQSDEIEKKPKIETGSYIGTGTSGMDNPNNLTFSFTPKIWGIYRYTHSGSPTGVNVLYMLPFGVTGTYGFAGMYGIDIGFTNILSYSGNTVSWYDSAITTSAAAQLNVSGNTYYYFAIG